MDHFWWTFVHSRYKSFVRKVDLMCKKSYLKAIEKFGVKTRKVLPLHVFLKLQEKSHSTIQHCERSELCLHCGWTKVHWKCKKIVNLASIWKPIACGQTMLPDKSIFIGQKLAKNATSVKLKCDILLFSTTVNPFKTFIFIYNTFKVVKYETSYLW